MPLPYITIDESRFPLVMVKYRGAVTDAEFDSYLSTITAFIERGRRFGAVLDTRHASAASATQRRRQAMWLREHQAELPALCLGCAFVVTSPIMRGALTAIFWIQPLAFPYVICAGLHDAVSWVEERVGIDHRAAPSERPSLWIGDG